ncbi:MAG: DUF6088 family protein [Bacillota bacterium]
MNIYTDLQSKYSETSVILLDEIYKLFDYLKADNVRQQLCRLVKEGLLMRGGNGIYYMPKTAIVGGVLPIDFEQAITKKFMQGESKQYGYYSGMTKLYKLNICNQMPNIREVVSNFESSRKRQINFCGQKVIVRKPFFEITNKNKDVLEFLDVVRIAYKYADTEKSKVTEKLIAEYANKITATDIIKYVDYYPASVAKIILKEFAINENFA